MCSSSGYATNFIDGLRNLNMRSSTTQTKLPHKSMKREHVFPYLIDVEYINILMENPHSFFIYLCTLNKIKIMDQYKKSNECFRRYQELISLLLKCPFHFHFPPVLALSGGRWGRGYPCPRT